MYQYWYLNLLFFILYMWQIDLLADQGLYHCVPCSFNPFPHTTILQQMTLNIFWQKKENLYNWMAMTKSGKKRRNCSFWAISSFVTMFSKSCQKASIWGKGLNALHFILPLTYQYWCYPWTTETGKSTMSLVQREGHNYSTKKV